MSLDAFCASNTLTEEAHSSMSHSSRSRIEVVRAVARSPLPAAQLIEQIIDAPLPDQFYDWLALKGVKGVEDQHGPWRVNGQRRVLRMTDGSVTLEQLVHYDAESGWTNVLSGLTNRVKHMLTEIEDDWRFHEDEHGTEVTWKWTFHSRPTAIGRLLTTAMVAPLHRPYLQRILDSNLTKAADRIRSRASAH